MEISSNFLYGDQVKQFDIFPHQYSAIEWMREIEYFISRDDNGFLKGGILADDMGLGKTRDFAALISVNQVNQTLLLCTPTTKDNWIRELLLCNEDRPFIVKKGKKILGGYNSNKTLVNVYLAEGSDLYKCFINKNGFPDKERVKSGEGRLPPFVLVCNNQLISKGNNSLLEIINLHEWDRIGIDEAGFLRNENSSYNIINSLRQPLNGNNRIGSRWAITGTPLQMDKDDIKSIFNFCDSRFVNINDDTLRYLISKNLFRRNSDQLTPFLKTKIKYPSEKPQHFKYSVKLNETWLSFILENLDYDNIKSFFRNCYNLGNPQNCILEYYNGICILLGFPAIDLNNQDSYNFYIELPSNFANLLNYLSNDERSYLIIKTHEINNKGVNFGNKENLRKLISDPGSENMDLFVEYNQNVSFQGMPNKLIEALKIIDQNNESFIVFHHFMRIKDKFINFLAENRKDYLCYEINGSVQGERRTEILLEAVNQKNQGRKVLLFLSMMATAEGLNCQEFNNAIFLEPGYNPKTEEQAIGRLQRIGQNKLVYIYEFILESFKCFGKIISIDENTKNLNEGRTELSRLIESYNAAWFYKRIYFTNDNGQLESGVYFDESFENQTRGALGCPDSVGPPWIDQIVLQN